MNKVQINKIYGNDKLKKTVALMVWQDKNISFDDLLELIKDDCIDVDIETITVIYNKVRGKK